MTPEKILKAEERVELARKALDLSDAAPTEIVAPDGAPCPTLIEWSKKHGVSLDWVIIGDVAPLIRGSSQFCKAPAARVNCETNIGNPNDS